MDNKFLEQPHETTKIKKVIGIVSGKGGVGKSLVTSLLAVAMSNKGYKVGVLDADVTGPSIPKVFGIKEKPFADNNENIFPVKSKKDISIMSANLLLERETDPVIWRGPVITGIIKQFWKNVLWNELDYMFIDMPPGTGDVPLTVFQTIPVNGIIVVTSPQELVSMIVEKAVNMAKMMDIPILGLVENMSYIKCPDCGKEIKIFGESKIDDVAKKFNISVVDKMPVNPEITALCDKGEIETAPDGNLKNIVDIL
ncbi:MAG: Mrp/NBP35 family ATP-binding protein [Elusimicrobia bacterium]|nr:Mrp/NBP35 family ATP-binding protein [Elusimicrobiota bacterium]